MKQSPRFQMQLIYHDMQTIHVVLTLFNVAVGCNHLSSSGMWTDHLFLFTNYSKN